MGGAVLAAWLAGGNAIAERLPATDAAGTGWRPPAVPPTATAVAGGDEDEPGPVVSFPLIEEASRALAERQVMTAGEYQRHGATAREIGFTVAYLATEEAVERVRDALVTNIREGGATGTLRAFREAVDSAIGDGVLTPAHLETVYRTNVAAAFADGQRRILAHPLVTSEFPYAAWHAIHDSRARPDHLAMEHAGLDGTNVYRSDDPELRRVWVPAGWNCRCAIVLLTLEQAARAGVREAREWLASGNPPAQPEFVPRVPVELPAGWSQGGP